MNTSHQIVTAIENLKQCTKISSPNSIMVYDNHSSVSLIMYESEKKKKKKLFSYNRSLEKSPMSSKESISSPESKTTTR